MKQIALTEEGSLRKVGEHLDAFGAQRIFLVTGRRSYSQCGAQAALESILAGRHVTHFFDFELNPKLEDVERGLALFRDTPHDAILAVGGGSTLDVAKLVSVLSGCRDPREVIHGRRDIEGKSAPVIAVPTTAGTGAEATHFAVVYVDHNKYSVASEWMLPDVAIVDSALTQSVPPLITAATGLDALCQGIESLWSVHSCDESRLYAREAISVAVSNLEHAVHRPAPNNRLAMSRASYLAGRAINITRTTAPHALSYTLTSRFGVPHGHAVSLTLGEMLLYISEIADDDSTDSRGPAYVRAITKEVAAYFNCEAPDEARSAIKEFITGLGLPTSLRDVGVTSARDRQMLVDTVNAQRLKNNPRSMDARAIRALFERIA